MGELARMGLCRDVDLRDRVAHDRGAWCVRDLVAGTYLLDVDAPGHATVHRVVQVPGEVEVPLPVLAPAFDVRVVSPANVPIAGARLRRQAPPGALCQSVLPTSFGLDTAAVLDAWARQEHRSSRCWTRWGCRQRSRCWVRRGRRRGSRSWSGRR